MADCARLLADRRSPWTNSCVVRVVIFYGDAQSNPARRRDQSGHLRARTPRDGGRQTRDQEGVHDDRRPGDADDERYSAVDRQQRRRHQHVAVRTGSGYPRSQCRVDFRVRVCRSDRKSSPRIGTKRPSSRSRTRTNRRPGGGCESRGCEGHRCLRNTSPTKAESR